MYYYTKMKLYKFCIKIRQTDLRQIESRAKGPKAIAFRVNKHTPLHLDLGLFLIA